MKIFPRRCECIWCCQVFYSEQFYKFGTCSSCLLARIVTPAPKFADILRQAEKEAMEVMRTAIRSIRKAN